MKMKKIVSILLAGALTFSLMACGNKDGKKTNSDSDTVVVDLSSEPGDLNTMISNDVASFDIQRMTVAGLVKLDENDQPQPDMAESWDVSDDKTTYTMHLREDAKWSNGEPVTANDFVYAWTLVCSPETASPYGFIVYDNIKNGKKFFDGEVGAEELGVKALDDYTLEVTFENPIPYALHLFTFHTYYPVNQKAYEEIGADQYAKDADKMVVNGAYKLEEWVHDDHITLVKNPDYYDADNTNIEKVKYVMIKDANASMNAFKAGEVDAIRLTGEQMEKLEAENADVQHYIDNSNSYMQYNLNTPGLDNAKIRRALGMAIDTKSLCENVRKDGSIPAGGMVPPTIAGANGKAFADARGDLGQFNPEEAKKLLEEGLAESNMQVSDLKLSLLTDDLSDAQKQAAFYQAQWEENLGITVEITPMPFKARLAAMAQGNFDIVMIQWGPDYNDAMTYLDTFTSTNGNNFGGYSNPEYDELIANAMKETDVEKRQEMLVECEKIIANDAPVSALYYPKKAFILSDRVKGLTCTGFQEWYFTKDAEFVK